jgi:hypothetical protein
MAQSGGRKALDFGRAKTLRNANEPGFALAVPLQDDDEFDAQSTTTGLRARYRDGVADVLFDAGDSEGPDAANVTAKTDGVSVLSNCRFDPPGWNCQGVYDTEQICTIIGGVNAFILGNDATGIGFIDDILIPITGTAGAACGAEQFAELLIADWVGACSTDNWGGTRPARSSPRSAADSRRTNDCRRQPDCARDVADTSFLLDMC